MRAAVMTAVAMLGLCASGPVFAEPAAQPSAAASARAQADTPPRRRAPPRIIVRPPQPSATPFPLPGAAYPGPGYVRDCTSWLEQDPRPSGTVIVPRMSCSWVRGRA
jgi:hypothetical protein